MGARQLEALHLSEDHVHDVCRFRASYGEMRLGELASLDKEIARRGKGEAAKPDEQQQRWSLRVEAASSFAEAGQWAMLIDPSGALKLWELAGLLYRNVDFGFGYCLSVMSQARGHGSDADVDVELESGLIHQLRRLAEANHAGRKEPPQDQDQHALPAPLRHPQQQVYLVLAAASIAGLDRMSELRDDLSFLLRMSPHRNGVNPVGALGTPIRALWNASNNLARRGSDDLQAVVDVVGAIARRYDEVIQQAMVNEYLWDNCASAVDVGDTTIAALTLSTFRAFGEDVGVGEVDRRFRRAIAEAAPPARAQVEIALDVAREVFGK
jgi:hypothetical protein